MKQNTLKPLDLIGIFISGVGLSVLLGVLSNTINGFVSPEYFKNILGWVEVSNIWRASIAQGILEGLFLGVVLSLVYTVVVGIVSRVQCQYRLGFKYLLWIFTGSFGCWIIGGILGLGLGALSPEFYRHTFIKVPEQYSALLRYAWVGGSLLGIELGGIVSIIVGSVLFRGEWKRLNE